MNTRRDFLKQAALLAAGGAGIWPASIQRALAIDPAPGTTYLDAEHVVILMQENRSFDHSYGTLRGVRGFNDPRAVTLPGGNPVWLQTNAKGETYAPFRLNIRDTKATWMSSLPHSWVDQVDARADGRLDGWLDAKRSGNRAYGHMPLTLGFYNREDIPFYYSLADAFTVCDQNFCSSLTGTTPNRLYLWTGTIRETPSMMSKANVRNEDVTYGSEARWTTFPERLEQHGISWRIYQNEISLESGFKGEEDAWLSNFTDNPIEWFTQFHVRYAPTYRAYLEAEETRLAAEIARLEGAAGDPEGRLAKLRPRLQGIREDRRRWTADGFAALTERERSLHARAFTTNTGDPDYRKLTTLTYDDGGTQRRMQVPKGDVLYQFRQDVRNGKLPTVSWLVSPENFSDHPGAPWYGAWYLSEALDILTQNPEVWKKTIFILCYDENDGYFDHVPPFVPPNPVVPGTGKVSPDIDPSVEHVRIEQEAERGRQHPGAAGRSGPIGLGFRVPLVIASPWSRGGYVCSQVFDHTSVLQLLERILSHRTGRKVEEPNISAWRRAVCGDLTSVFRPYRGEKIDLPTPVNWTAFAGAIHQAQFKQVPDGFRKFDPAAIEAARKNPAAGGWMPRQEPGVRPACPIPYDLEAAGQPDTGADPAAFRVEFSARRGLFGAGAAGAPFHVYAPVPVRAREGASTTAKFEPGRTWAYAVTPGSAITDRWRFEDFEGGRCHLRVHGPNGFYREFICTQKDPSLRAEVNAVGLQGDVVPGGVLHLENPDPKRSLDLVIEDLSYGGGRREVRVGPAATPEARRVIPLGTASSHGWYDTRIRIAGNDGWERRLAGHVETGRESVSDPLMGRAVG